MYIFSESSNESTGKYSPDQGLVLMPNWTLSPAESISTKFQSRIWKIEKLSLVMITSVLVNSKSLGSTLRGDRNSW